MSNTLRPLATGAEELISHLTDKLASLRATSTALRNEGKIAEAAKLENEIVQQERTLAQATKTSSAAVEEGVPTASPAQLSPEQEGFDRAFGATPKPIPEVDAAVAAAKAETPMAGPLEQAGPMKSESSVGQLGPFADMPTQGRTVGMPGDSVDGMFDAIPKAPMSGKQKAAIGAGGAAAAVGTGATVDWSDKAKEAPPITPTLPPITTPEGAAPLPKVGSGETTKTGSTIIPYRKIASDFESLKMPPYKDAAGLEGSEGLIAKNQNQVIGKAAELKSGLDNLMAAHNVAKGNLEKRELYEKIVQAMGLIAAGLYGNKTGTSLDGVKFTASDWAAKATDLQRDLSNTTGMLKEKYGVDMDVLNKEKQRLADTKQEQRFKYEEAYRNYEDKFRKMTTSTNEAQQERGVENALLQWNAQEADRIQKAKGAGKDSVEALAQSEEKLLEAKKKEWRGWAYKAMSAKGDDAKTEATNQAMLLDADIRDLTGVGMLKDSSQYEDKSGWFSWGSNESLGAKADAHEASMNALKSTNPTAAKIIQQRGKLIRDFTVADMAASNNPSLSNSYRTAQSRYKDYLSKFLDTTPAAK